MFHCLTNCSQPSTMSTTSKVAKKIDDVCSWNFIDDVDTILVDCDGVIWNGSVVIPGAPETISKFISSGKAVFFVTNNSTKTRAEYVSKCEKMGFHVNEGQIICTAFLAASHLKSTLGVKKVYVFGSTGITQELDKVGIEYPPIGPDPVESGQNFNDWGHIKLENDIEAVVVGFDEHISYRKILKAASYLKNPACHFVATNADEVFPMEGTDVVIPGTGSILSSVITASGRQPTILGKPHTTALQVIREVHHVDPSRTLMIGDRLNTDILFGYNCGFKTIAVGTGITSESEINNLRDPSLVPDYFVNSIASLAGHIK